MRALALAVFVMFVAMPLAFASVAEVLEPVAVNVNDGETVFLGTIGPGQTLFITVNGKAIGNEGREANWGVLGVMEVPTGWEGFDSVPLARQMRATVKADPTARDGTYKVKFLLTECERKNMQCEPKQGLGSVTFYGTVAISKNVLASSVINNVAEAGVGQPARYNIVIENKGSASDVFEISSSGVSAWSYNKTVHVAPSEKVITFYEFVLNEEKEYTPTIIIKSKSSELIKNEFDVGLIVKSDIIGDIRATKNGVLIFPVILEPLYSLLGILANLL